MESEKKPIILSGITPTGILTIGHLTGALKNWVELQDKYEAYYMMPICTRLLLGRKRQTCASARSTPRLCLSRPESIPERSTLFIQSHVPSHAQLAWVLHTFTGYGECAKMTQFKDKSAKHADNVNVGLFAYPVLMAADILLYQADLVPVGEDQKQHLELSRNLAQRFNFHYSETFKMPEPFIPKVGARIMSLQDPTNKMSKSDENEKSIIFLNESADVVRNKIKRAVTDSGSEVKYDTVNKPGVSNLMTLYSIATGRSFAEIEAEFAGKGYGDFKPAVADAVADYLTPIRERFEEVRNDKNKLNEYLAIGADKARKAARRTLSKVYKKIGFVSL